MNHDILYLSRTDEIISLRLIRQKTLPSIYSQSCQFHESLYAQIKDEVNHLNTQEQVSDRRIQQIGSYIYQLLFSGFVRSGYDLFSVPAILFVCFHDHLHQIPIELAYNGHTFLGLQRCVVRTLHTKNQLRDTEIAPKSLMVFVDPQQKLEHAYREGKALFDFIHSTHTFENIDFISCAVSKLDFLNILESYTMLHLAGHTDTYIHRSSNTNSDALLNQNDLQALKKFPQFVFFHSCESNCFLVDGHSLGNESIQTNTIINTQLTIRDYATHTKAVLKFYTALLQHNSCAQAFQKLQTHYYESESTQWASYCLYGNPHLTLA